MSNDHPGHLFRCSKCCYLYNTGYDLPDNPELFMVSDAILLQKKSDRQRRNEEIHYDKVAGTSKHHKDMKNLMGAKVFVSGIKKWNFQGIDHTADGVNNSACKKPVKACARECVKDRDKCKDAEPAHANIQYGGQPFRTCDPASFQDHTEDCNAPYQCA